MDFGSNLIKLLKKKYIKTICEFFSPILDHIFEKLSPAMDGLGLECTCLGGGKIEHDSNKKKLRVFGESMVKIQDFIIISS